MRYRYNEANLPRLGLIVSKKMAKLAVQRNYMRRVLRELFRLNQHNLPVIDLVIQVQKPFNKPEFMLIKQEFKTLLLKLSTKIAPAKES
jgi:ribonuclease P protein component